jgi:hypothetical protein
LINQDWNTFGPIVPTSPNPGGPGGNPIVPTPATPNEWPKMIIAIAVGASGIWFIDSMFSENAAKWTAVIVLLGIVTYYETHGNKHFSQGITDLAGILKW